MSVQLLEMYCTPKTDGLTETEKVGYILYLLICIYIYIYLLKSGLSMTVLSINKLNLDSSFYIKTKVFNRRMRESFRNR